MTECRECTAKRVQARYRMQINSLRLRDKCFDLLGHVCNRCGFSDKRALQFDHVNGGGYADRKKHRGQAMYRNILSTAGAGFQVLCANCNWIKKHEDRELGQFVVE